MQITTEENVLQAIEYTRQLSESLGYSTTEQVLFSLVTEEALVNALEHCGQRDETNITIYWCTLQKSFEIAVTQPGAMFYLEKQKDVNTGNRGRGLQLILNIMDDVWLERQEGNIVMLHMIKHTD